MDHKNAALIVAGAHPRGVSQTRLLKLIWLAELEHYMKTGEKLTDASWFRYDHGPFSKEILRTVEEEDCFDQEEFMSSHGVRAKLIRSDEATPEGDQDAIDTLESVVWKYEKYETSELLEEVYGDPFFEETPFGHDFDFDRLPDCRRLPVTIDELDRDREEQGERFKTAEGVLSDI